MYERETSSTTYKIPQCCCSCLGPANKLLMIVHATEWTHEGVKYRKSYDLDVPICTSCKRLVYKRRLLGVGIFLGILAVAWIVWQQEWDEWEIWASIALAVAGFITVTVLWFSGLPAEIEENGLPKFQNGEYQKLFEQLNGIEPWRYSNYEFVETVSDKTEPTVAISAGQERANSEPLFEFGSATTILRFPVGSESQYINHTKLLEHLADSHVLPNASICGLKACSNASSARLILITGTPEALRDLSKIYYSSEAEALVRQEFNNDWARIDAASTLSNVAEPGFAIGDLGPFAELCQEIESGSYQLDKVIAHGTNS